MRYGNLAANARYVSCPSAIGGTIGNDKNAPYVTGLTFNCVDHPTDQIKPEVPQNNTTVYPIGSQNNTAVYPIGSQNNTVAMTTNDNSMSLMLLFVAIVVGLAIAYYSYGGSGSSQQQAVLPQPQQFALPPQQQ